ncbi:hypothetical protein ACHAWX_005326 [Stephanocyclus meneghinianus]
MPLATAVQNLVQKETYLRESRELLKKSFPLISCDAINFIFDRKADFSFSDAFHRLSFIKTHPDTLIEDKPGIRIFIKYPRKTAKQELRVTNTDLLVEIDSIPELNQKVSGKHPEIIDLSTDENGEDGEKEARFECHVCYADYVKSEIEDCGAGEGHFVCKHCICRFVSEQLHGNGSLKFKCIGDANCTREYLPALLEKVLPEDLNRQVIDRTFHEVAKLPGMWQCPAGCGHVGFAGEMFPWVECPVCICQYCTKCNEKYHQNKTCTEARQESETMKNPVHRAHEAMTKATKRFCPYPTCTQEFIKGEGCNKIKCISCNGLSCYLCGGMIKDYQHFKERGGTCDLWTSTEVLESMDRKKQIEAGRKVLKDAGISDDNEILRLLALPNKEKVAKGNNQDRVATRPNFAVNNQEQQFFDFGNDRDRQNVEAFAYQREGRPQVQANQNIGRAAVHADAPPVNANPAAPRFNFRMNDREQHIFFQVNDRHRENPAVAEAVAAALENADRYVAVANEIVGRAAVNVHNFRMNDGEQQGFIFGNYRDHQNFPHDAGTANQNAGQYAVGRNVNVRRAAVNALNFREQQAFVIGNYPDHQNPPHAATANQQAKDAAGANRNVGRAAAHDNVPPRLLEQINNLFIADPNGETHRVIGHQPPQIQNHRQPMNPAFAPRPHVPPMNIARNPFQLDHNDDDSVVTNAAVVWKPN